MGIGTIIHGGTAIISLLTGNIPLALAEGGKAISGYALGKALEPITEPIKEVLGDWVGETCNPDIVDNLPYL